MAAGFDSDYFRQVLSNMPTSVTVVTGVDSRGEPYGITIGSCVSVSLDPPLIGFFPGVASKSWPAIATGKSFCVNVLSDTQSELCWQFANEVADGSSSRFAGVAWDKTASGMPLISGAVAWIDCTIESVSTVGDHLFVLGKVQNLGVTGSQHEAMVFYKGKTVGIKF